MRPLALVLLVVGFAGVVIGVLSNVLPDAGPFSVKNTEATWVGIGPVFAGLVMMIAGYFMLERRPRI